MHGDKMTKKKYCRITIHADTYQRLIKVTKAKYGEKPQDLFDRLLKMMEVKK